MHKVMINSGAWRMQNSAMLSLTESPF